MNGNIKNKLKKQNIMTQTTLQQRIEERAGKQLLEDMLLYSNKEREIHDFFGDSYPRVLAIREHFNYNNKREIVMENEFTKKAFNDKLPAYVANITDEILREIDQIKYLVGQTDYTKLLDNVY